MIDERRWERLVCWIKQDGIVVVYGFAQLQTCTNKELSIVVKAQNSEFIDDIRDKQLSDLDLSDLDHIVNLANVEANRFNDYTSDYVYPDIDYNLLRGVTGDVPYWFLFPAVFARRVLIQIVEDAGYTLQGDILDDATLKRMIIPFSRSFLRVAEGYVIDNQFFANMIAETLSLPFPSTASINAAGFDTTTAGYYDNSGYFTDGVWGSFTPNAFYQPTEIINQTLRFSCNFTVSGWGANTTLSIKIKGVTATVPPETTGEYIHEDNGDADGYFSIDIYVEQGDIPASSNYIEVLLGNDVYDAGYTVQMHSGVFWNEVNEQYYDLNPLDMAANLPDMLQSDYLKYIVNLFSLLMVTDKQAGTLTLHYFDDVPTNPPIDWSGKIDLTEDPTFTPNYGDYSLENVITYDNNEDDEGLKNDTTYAEHTIVKDVAPKGAKVMYVAPFSASKSVAENPNLMFIHVSDSANRRTHTMTMTLNLGIMYAVVSSTTKMSSGDPVIFRGLSHATTQDGVLLDGKKGVTIDEIISDTEFTIGGVVLNISTSGDVIHIDSETTNDPSPRIAMHDVIDGAAVGTIQLIGGSTVTQASRVTFTELEWEEAVDRSWSVLEAIIQSPQQVSCLMRLSPSDVNQLDFTQPIWVDHFGCYFYISFVEQYKVDEVDSTMVELIKLP